MTHTLDIPFFRTAFPAFSDPVKYPDARIQANWDLAVAYLGDADGCLLNGDAKQAALNFLTAHLLYLSDLTGHGGGGASVGGAAGGVLTGAQVDKVQVQFAPPPFKNGWDWWLMQSPYGSQLQALLRMKSAGGWYVGGLPERDAFRRVYGGFGPGRRGLCR